MNNNLEEFTNPTLYDVENRWGVDDEFYLAIAKRTGGPVLDLACGTGRLTRAIAEQGITVLGADVMQPMLDRAAELAPQLDIEWINADCREFNLSMRFRLVLMTSHAFQFLLTDQDQTSTLSRIHDHLVAGGLFAFETRNRSDNTFRYSIDGTRTKSVQDDQGHWIDVQTTSHYDPESQIDHIEKISTIRQSGESWSYRIALRYTPIADINRLLQDRGFSILEQYGDWDCTKFSASSPEIITVCRKN